MTSSYLILLRTVWLGGLWVCAWLVRPILQQQGYFPHHGLTVMHWMVGVGVVIAALIFMVGALGRALNWRSRPLHLLIAMTTMSLMYFGLMPWWKLQMVIVHALCALGVLWLMLSPRQVL